MKILVVEDQPIELKLAEQVLSAAGHAVRSAEGAEQALAAIAADRPNIILLDMLLPAIDGLTFVRRLKADPETRGIHVVAVTSYPERFSRADALAAGCAAYLRKPLNTRELPRMITEAVKTAEARSAP
jgi:two-component system cell cycle response regulator